eukprot:m.14499 g.14499  ORF g.14499 m.14499 type:complete len:395 (+) comp25766_c0_seq1:174-1358(+)
MEERHRQQSDRFYAALVVVMVAFGALDTISLKWADRSDAVGQKGVYEESLCSSLFGLIRCHDYLPTKSYLHSFTHPFVQAFLAFFGQILALLVHRFRSSRQRNQETDKSEDSQKMPFMLFVPPTIWAVWSFALRYIGLSKTHVSSFLMLKGSSIVFTALLSMAFLRTRIPVYQWIGCFLTVVSLVIVGVGDALVNGSQTPEFNSHISGDLLIVMSELLYSCKIVYEEKILKKHGFDPFQAVGLEGIIGSVLTCAIIICLYFVPATLSELRPKRLENGIDAFIQIGSNWKVAVAILGFVIGHSVFDCSGLIVTCEISAVTRIILENVRVLIVWMASLSLGWETFTHYQLIGYCVLVGAALIYGNLVFVPLWKKCRERKKKKNEVNRNDIPLELKK